MGHELGRQLAGSSRSLCETYDTAIFDLDGVVYVGPAAVSGAPGRIRQAESAGMRLAYVTNNASRPPSAVAEHLREIGLFVDADDVVTAAQAAARMVRTMVPDGAAVLVVGGTGLVEAVGEHGLQAVSSMEDHPAAVVQGFSPDVGWRALTEAVAAVDAGLPWVASNLDATVPTSRGRAPGNGLLVDVVAGATGGRPRVAGKPERALFDETVLRVGGERPLVVGDRIDTDIEGAVRCGHDSLLVLTGITDVATLCLAPAGSRPTYVAQDLGGLLARHPEVHLEHHTGEHHTTGEHNTAVCGGWTCRIAPDRGRSVALTGAGQADDALRALVTACWAHHDRAGKPLPADDIDTAWHAGVQAGARYRCRQNSTRSEDVRGRG